MAAVLDRSELEASPLADLHAIADQLGLDGFRRLRKADLIDRILGDAPAPDADDEPSSTSQEQDTSERPSRGRRRGGRSRRSSSAASRADSADAEEDTEDLPEKAPGEKAAREKAPRERGGRRERSRSTRTRDDEPPKDVESDDGGTVAEGVVEVLGNGSAFLRIDPPEPSDGDVYISAAQVRRCELVSGDRVAGPARTPRRSERYPSLVRVDTINGTSADAVSAGTRYEDLPVDYPSERIALEAIEWLTPFGRGSRVTIVGAARAGKTETLRGLLAALAADQGSASDGLEVSLVLAGARPE